MKTTPSLPMPVVLALQKLGADIRAARLRRRIPVALMAERASIVPNTLLKIEKGDPTTSMAGFASVLFVLGLSDRLKDIADIGFDSLGKTLAAENLPKRIRFSKKRDNNE